MKIKALALAAVLLMTGGSIFAQSVTVTKKKITYTRPKARDQYTKHFDIEWPKVKASTPAISRRIENALSYQRVLDLDLNQELHGSAWLHEASFDVEYNKHRILGVMMFMEGSGAYPSGTTKRVLVDTRTGNPLRPADLFANLPGLTAMLKKAQQAEIAAAIAELKKDPENTDIETTFKESAKYHPLKLDQMKVTDQGVTFYHDYAFAHVIQALQPDGEYPYTWAQLGPYIKQSGPLAAIAR
jgi:hypothetical protein